VVLAPCEVARVIGDVSARDVVVDAQLAAADPGEEALCVVRGIGPVTNWTRGSAASRSSKTLPHPYAIIPRSVTSVLQATECLRGVSGKLAGVRRHPGRGPEPDRRQGSTPARRGGASTMSAVAHAVAPYPPTVRGVMASDVVRIAPASTGGFDDVRRARRHPEAQAWRRRSGSGRHADRCGEQQREHNPFHVPHASPLASFLFDRRCYHRSST
jgi:hypothetical protein